jgi:signal transduction histidine kinase/CheY-like chemotaxis protein
MFMVDHGIAMRNHVIVLDDEPGITSLCQRLLERANFEVTSYTNPSDALKALETQTTVVFQPDLLLVDIRMPGMDGFEVVDAVRQYFPDLAVLVMTGFGTVETAVEALRRGADGLVLKPFSAEELVQSVRRALEQSQHKQDVLRLQALRPLFDVSESLFTETNPKRLRNLVLDAVCGHLKCSHAEFYQVDTSSAKSAHGTDKLKPRLRLLAAVHRPLTGYSDREKTGDTKPLDPEVDTQPPIALLTEPIAHKSAAQKMSMLIHQENKPIADNEEAHIQQILASRGLSSVICTPVSLKAGAIVTGVLFAARKVGEPRFREADLELLVVLARQAAVALENARLHAELRDKLRQLEDSQRALIQAEKMATAGRLTASIAHEINNPLQAVQNCLHLAERPELTAEQRKSYLGMASNEMDRLMQTVNRMLDFYRPTALDRKPIDINPLLDRVISLVGNQLEEQSIHVHRNFGTSLPPILAVSDQILQVFLNLILNAMEAMPRGGDIFLETILKDDSPSSRKLILEPLALQKEVEIYIEDTGPGIPLSEQKHVFEPFVSTKEKGTGLGLAVSYGIVTAHGGRLELIDHHTRAGQRFRHEQINAKLGNGACFRVSLPIAETT